MSDDGVRDQSLEGLGEPRDQGPTREGSPSLQPCDQTPHQDHDHESSLSPPPPETQPFPHGRTHDWTYMGFERDSGYGPWRFQLFESEDALREKLRLFAGVEDVMFYEDATDPTAPATARVTSASLQPCLNEEDRSQDRRVVQSWNVRGGKWIFVGVFDGHAGHETVDHAAAELPRRIRYNLEALLEETRDTSISTSTSTSTSHTSEVERVSSLLATTISEFDRSLLDDLLSLFPGGYDAAVSLPDAQIQDIINDAGGENLKKVHRCKQGSTALVSLVDPSGEHLWVANLGDCEAVLGTKECDGTWTATPLSSNHNGGNEEEVQRVRDEHPGEEECVLKGRVLGAVAVTRALGDYLFKLPAAFTTSVLSSSEPGVMLWNKRLWQWLARDLTPPYLSNRSDVVHHRLPKVGASTKTDATTTTFLLMCSDGLTAVYPKEHNDKEHWVKTVGEAMERGESPVLALLWEALGGNARSVSEYLTLESTEGWMDDTTLVVMTL